MTLKTEHKGHEVEYNEVNDDWRCASLSLTSQSLALIRKAIDRKLSALRKVAHVEAFVVPYSLDRTVRKVKIVEYAGRSISRYGNKRPIDDVFVVGDGSSGRTKREVESLFLPTEENMKLVEEYEAIKAQIENLELKARETIKGVTPVTLDDIRPLVEAYGSITSE